VEPSGPPPKFFGPILVAARFDQTLAFYRDALGLPFEGEAPYARCTAGPSRFGIVEAGFWAKVHGSDMQVHPGTLLPPSTILALEVEDLDARVERLLMRGVPFLTMPATHPEVGRRNAFLRDPDGRTVELATRV